ncbi:MAG: LegC family aminotransferase [Cellulosilyticaceae bacterium]
MIPLSVPNLKGNETKYVLDALEKEWVSTSGNYVNRFEREIGKYLKVSTAIACQSGTAALHLALMLSGVKANDEVIVPTLTFIAAVNPVKYLGAEPIFMDCQDDLNMDCEKLAKFLKKECSLTRSGLVNKTTKRTIKAIVVVHVFGNMANMEQIMDLAHQYELKVIEDATEALGTYYTQGNLSGKFAGTIGDFGAYSFNGNKIITTGGGGLLVGRNTLLVEKARYLSTQAKDDELYYKHDEIGYNYRMTNLQAAIGTAQLESLEKFIQIKTENYNRYKEGLTNIDGFELLNLNLKARNNHWFYALMITDNHLTRDKLLMKMRDNNIQTRPIWQLIHTQTPYLQNQKYYIEKATYYLEKILNIPCSTNLKSEEIEYILSVLKGL